MKIALRVTTNQLLVLGKGHVAFDDSRGHASGGFVRLFRMFRELQRSTPMPDRKTGLPKRLFVTLL
jgi:hypothetical protein